MGQKHKVIVSSTAMARLLDQQDDLCLQCVGKTLRMGRAHIIVECKTSFEYELQYEQVNRLLRTMRAIGEQPVVITFEEEGGFVQLDQVLF